MFSVRIDDAVVNGKPMYRGTVMCGESPVFEGSPVGIEAGAWAADAVATAEFATVLNLTLRQTLMLDQALADAGVEAEPHNDGSHPDWKVPTDG